MNKHATRSAPATASRVLSLNEVLFCFFLHLCRKVHTPCCWWRKASRKRLFFYPAFRFLPWFFIHKLRPWSELSRSRFLWLNEVVLLTFNHGSDQHDGERQCKLHRTPAAKIHRLARSVRRLLEAGRRWKMQNSTTEQQKSSSALAHTHTRVGAGEVKGNTSFHTALHCVMFGEQILFKHFFDFLYWNDFSTFNTCWENFHAHLHSHTQPRRHTGWDWWF